MKGRDACHLHGGKSVRGISHPRYVNGRYSKDLPAALLNRYLQSLEDPRALDLRNELALVDVRIGQLLEMLDGAGPSLHWRQLELILDSDEEDDVKLAQLSSAIRTGSSDWQRWNEVFSAIEKRQKLVESERRRAVEMQQMITADQLSLLLGALVDVIRKHVTDRDQLIALSTDISRLLSPGTVESAGGQP